MIRPRRRTNDDKKSGLSSSAAGWIVLAFWLGGYTGYTLAASRMAVLSSSEKMTATLQPAALRRQRHEDSSLGDSAARRGQFADGEVDEGAGWKLLHVFTGGRPDQHLEIIQPMAQAKQDQYVAAMLRNRTDGYFLEMGANDATYLSNTYTLERDLNWTGREYTYVLCLMFLLLRRSICAYQPIFIYFSYAQSASSRIRNTGGD